jgi:hypothetical protein
VVIWRPASRSRFGGLAFHDLDDVEGSHVRHDPPAPWPAQAVNRCHRPGTGARALRAPGPATGDGTGRTFPPIGAEQAMPIQIPNRGFALSGTARRPRTRQTADRGRCRRSADSPHPRSLNLPGECLGVSSLTSAG